MKDKKISLKKILVVFTLLFVAVCPVFFQIGYVLASSSATHTVSTLGLIKTASIIVVKSGTTFYAVDGTTGEEVTSSTDALTVLHAARDELTDRGTIFLRNANYSLSASYVPADYVRLIGETWLKVYLHAEGDFPVVNATASSTGWSVEQLTIIGGGKANSNAHGIKTGDVVTRATVQKVKFQRCRHAIDVTGAWEYTLRDIHVFGTGSSQNYIGLYAHVPSGSNTALIVDNLNIRQTESHGIRMEHISGSKWTNIEVGTPGGKGVYIGDPSSATEVEFMHGSVFLVDQPTEEAYYFSKGSATRLRAIEIDTLWAAHATTTLFMNQTTELTINNIIFKNSTQHQVHFYNATRNTISNGVCLGWDVDDTGSYDAFFLEGGSDNNRFGTIDSYSAYTFRRGITVEGDYNSFVNIGTKGGTLDTGSNNIFDNVWNGTDWLTSG